MTESLALYDHGFHILPLKRASKEPAVKTWSHESRVPRDVIARHRGNFAMVHGPLGGTCALDPEGAATIGWLSAHFDDVDTPVVRTGKSAPGEPRLHVYLKWQPRLPTFLRAEGINPIKVQREGCYTVLPGSVHPDTGRPYELLRGSFATLAPFPASLLPYGTGIKTASGTFGAPFELPPLDTITVGERRPIMNQLIASLVTSGNCDQFEVDGVLNVPALQRFVHELCEQYAGGLKRPLTWDRNLESFFQRSFAGALRLRASRPAAGPRLDDGPCLDDGPELAL